ncbi:MAG TPA: histidine kinase dimerization/phosphoacceptor domain -containing protein [Sphingobium sp.]
MQIFDWLIYPVNLTPHGYCLLWAPGLIWLHAVSDTIIALAYFSIPLALIWFVHQRKDLEFRWVFLLFVCFIMACGMTHVMAVLTLWVAAYGLEGIIKVATAGLSVATAMLLWPLIPRLLALPSPAQLATVNASLQGEIAEKDRIFALLRASEEQVRQTNAELEARVAERTADLVATNERLTQALAQLEGARAELEATVKERTDALNQRDLLLREVYHRVKNNLQIVDAVIQMQSAEAADQPDRVFLEALRSRVYALGLVHQQLMTSTDLKTFDLAPFLRELTENLVIAGATGDVEMEVSAMPLSVGLDFAVPMGLIVTELLTNSLKHAFPDGKGKVTVSVARERENDPDSDIVVIVQDNGRGDQSASEPARKAGLGKRLIQGLLRQLEGRMIVEGKAGQTTRIFIPKPRAT